MFRKTSTLLLSVISLLLLLAPSAMAQTSMVTPGTLTVTGEGIASAPADTASVIIMIGPDTNMYVDPVAQTSNSDITPMPISLTAVDTTAVVDAIVASGIPAENVETLDPIFQGEWGSGMQAQPATIIVTIDQPSVEQLSALLYLTRTTAADEGLFVNQFSVLYTVDDCRVLNQAARVDAVANARINAEDQAAAMDTTLGDAVASRDTTPMSMGFYEQNGCNSVAGNPSYAIKMGAPQFDPTRPAEVTVYVAVEITFEIP